MSTSFSLIASTMVSKKKLKAIGIELFRLKLQCRVPVRKQRSISARNPSPKVIAIGKSLSKNSKNTTHDTDHERPRSSKPNLPSSIIRLAAAAIVASAAAPIPRITP